MKTYKFLIIPIFSIILIINMSCDRNFEPKFNDNIPIEDAQSLNEIDFNKDFDWETTRNIEFTITGNTEQVITISSVDLEVRYHRGHFMVGEDYKITINIPKTVESVLVNNRLVNLSSDHIICNLDQ